MQHLHDFISELIYSFRCIIIVLFFMAPLPLHAFDSATVFSYIAQYKDIALNNEKEFGIPASITLAQGILESAAGTSILTKASNNHFGIKAGSEWTGPVYRAWDDEITKSRFRSYASAQESYRDYAVLLSTNRRYQSLFQISVYNYRAWAHGLKNAGYATAENYAQALIGIIDHYKLYSVNGGVKLRQGRMVAVEISAGDADQLSKSVVSNDELTEEELVIANAVRNYAVEINGIHCAVIQPGENLASISRKYDISSVELLKFNELSNERQAKEGTIIFLNKKKKKYEGPQDVYIAREGETLHDVSQMFGIRLSQLAKINHTGEYVRLVKGSRVHLK